MYTNSQRTDVIHVLFQGSAELPGRPPLLYEGIYNLAGGERIIKQKQNNNKTLTGALESNSIFQEPCIRTGTRDAYSRLQGHLTSLESKVSCASSYRTDKCLISHSQRFMRWKLDLPTHLDYKF